jgi:lauroyl/myristoyl acyltransferase
MEGSGRLALTGSLFALPLTVLGAALTLVGWLMTKLGDRRRKVT